jgi:hypothetical protein
MNLFIYFGVTFACILVVAILANMATEDHDEDEDSYLSWPG